MSNPNDIQIGGDHYRVSRGHQHWDLIDLYRVGYLEGIATKYLTRFRRKEGLKDLKKALHTIQKLIRNRVDLSYSEQSARKPNVPRSAVADYVRDNNCHSLESEAIEHLLTWNSTATLSLAEQLVNRLIAEFEGSEATSAYVNQDR